VATTTLNVLGIAGSLRRGSYNRMALRAAQKLAPAGMEIEAYEGLRDIPLYDEVTPEYNYSVPGVLKNAIDWASRPPDQPFDDKPVAIMSASPGALGGARAQYHLRQCFVYLDAKLLNRPEVMIGQCAQKFAADGTLTDEATATQIGKQLEALAAWTRRLKPR
jgi:chromate reductase, NAD(P)H dehydrogenase (quinone)